jgi:hypothetical protein
MHNAKDSFGRALIVRHLYGQCSGPVDRLQKKACRDIGRHSQLSRFQHDVPLSGTKRVSGLCAVRNDGNQ